MNPAQKLSLSAVVLLATLAGLLFLIEWLRAPPAEMSERASQAVGNGLVSPAPLNRLIVPVRGQRVADLIDTWGAPRGGGRTHQGIDIIAADGVPVLAAVDGRIVKFFDSARGGASIYQFDEDARFVYLYGHLRERGRDLAEGDLVRRGQIIGYVGQSGNATTPHLHFEIQRLGEDQSWWTARSINPYPYLKAGRAPR